MSPQNSSDDRAAKYVVISIAIVALVLVAWIDAAEGVELNNVVYWILGGAILGAENIVKILRK